jgi:hypothetical protein
MIGPNTSFAPTKGMLCDFDVAGESFVCKNCGIRIPQRLSPSGKPFVVCTKPVVGRPEPEPAGLGDMVASALDGVGITKDRVQALAKKVGINDCGCSRRQEMMNRFGQKYLGIGRPKK